MGYERLYKNGVMLTVWPRIWSKPWFWTYLQIFWYSKIDAQLNIIKHYPIFFSDAEGRDVGKEVTLEGIGLVLKKLETDKILGPDG